jgi:hypothetical protein
MDRDWQVSWLLLSFHLLSVLLVASLIRKRDNAAKSVAVLRGSFEDLTASIAPAKIAAWTKLEQKAMDKRGNHLKIYTIKKDKGEEVFFVFMVLF